MRFQQNKTIELQCIKQMSSMNESSEISHPFLNLLLSNEEIFILIFVAFSEYMNFMLIT